MSLGLARAVVDTYILLKIEEERGVWGRMDMCICIYIYIYIYIYMADSLYCPPEAATTLLIDFSLI